MPRGRRRPVMGRHRLVLSRADVRSGYCFIVYYLP
jgi:hypothetical protein